MQNRYKYLMRTIKDIDLVAIEEAIRHQFIPAITGGKQVNDNERKLISLPPRYGGLGIQNPTQTSEIEFQNSLEMTKDLVGTINGKYTVEPKKSKFQLRSEKHIRYKNQLE